MNPGTTCVRVVAGQYGTDWLSPGQVTASQGQNGWILSTLSYPLKTRYPKPDVFYLCAGGV